LTNEGTAKIKYVAQITDPAQYDANLVETVAARLAHEIAYAISGSTTLVQLMDVQYQTQLKEARFVDATEGATTHIEASDFIEARF
jgi:hypothetical protein